MSARRQHPSGRVSTDEVVTATAFLDNQATCLARGLEHVDAPALVRSVLDQHDASHPAWVSLIAWAGLHDEAVRDVLADAYGQHGRCAGALEGANGPLLSAEVRAKVLAFHRRELEVRTAAAARALEGLLDPAP